ncbi:SlyX family protein [Halomonas sp. DP8Y7-3]|uniref:SlyX family protein n=1 Tax=Halomonas sp. DP8Y7-3 TaxID=2859079 RepID=UPI001C960FC4|nr:SlyX family protein [Halomonas sp. DP8Y7-3]MBY5927791.1 SlyX family protein [Halomonas sp. DP8Y7-3]
MNSDTPQHESITGIDKPSADLAKRVEDLESRLAYQEHWLDSLDATIASQERRMMELERINRLMQQRLRELSADNERDLGDTPGPEDELPPHY